MYQHAKAGYPYLWINSSEDDRIIREQRKKIPPEVSFMRWDIVEGMRGFVNPNGDATQWVWKPFNGDLQNPVEALQAIQGAPEDAIIFMHDFHEFFQDVTVQRCALNLKDHLKATSKMIVFLSHGTAIPAAMRDAVKILNFDMPKEAELYALLEKMCSDTGVAMPENPDTIVDAMRGLTLEGAENALALSMVSKEGKVDYRVVLDTKAAMLEATGYLQYEEYLETFEDLFGLDVLKEDVPPCVVSGEGTGIIITGVPGGGKSHFFKALGNETQKPTLSLNIGGLRGGIIGESEHNTMDAFKRISAFNGPIVFVDEIEKAISGMGEGGKSDGGVGDRIGLELLRYLEDHQGESYWGATCNDLEPILQWSSGALASRFDNIYFLDMPSQRECEGIARIWSEKKNVDIPAKFDFEGWTGRDIKKLARMMKMLNCDAEKASRSVIPTAQLMGGRLDEIRKKFQKVCLSASRVDTVAPGVRKIKVAK